MLSDNTPALCSEPRWPGLQACAGGRDRDGEERSVLYEAAMKAYEKVTSFRRPFCPGSNPSSRAIMRRRAAKFGSQKNSIDPVWCSEATDFECADSLHWHRPRGAAVASCFRSSCGDGCRLAPNPPNLRMEQGTKVFGRRRAWLKRQVWQSVGNKSPRPFTWPEALNKNFCRTR